MSLSPRLTYPNHPHHGRPVTVHDHDILCGRGVNIASHKGNERFRALVQSRHDEDYCTLYTTSEKRAIAEQILRHIQSLDPPGRFLKRIGRAPTSRGLGGPWEELSYREAIKKTCQALRDCNRQDRTGYASAVDIPEDVKAHAQARGASGLSNKEQAARAAAAKASAVGAPPPPGTMSVAVIPGPMPMPPYAAAGPTGLVPVPMSVSVPIGMAMPIRPDHTSSQAYMTAPSVPLAPPPPQPTHHHHHHPPTVHPPTSHPPPPQMHHTHPPGVYPPHLLILPAYHLEHNAAAAAYHQHQQHQITHDTHGQQQQPPPPPTPTGPPSVLLTSVHAQHQPASEIHQLTQTHQQLHHQPVPPPLLPRIPTDGSLKRSRSNYEGDRNMSPSGETERPEKQNAVDYSSIATMPMPPPPTPTVGQVAAPNPLNTRLPMPNPIQTSLPMHPPTGHAITPSSTGGSIPGYFSESLLSSYDAHTPSQETSTTFGTTPTPESTAPRAHRSSLSPASAMPPSPTLAYDPRRAGAVDPTLYSHDFGGTPPTPANNDQNQLYAFHHVYHDNAEAPYPMDPGHPYATSAAALLEQQQLQEAAAFVNATSDTHTTAEFATASPTYHHDDSLSGF